MNRCFRDDEIAAIAVLPAGDARRAHVEECPRCHALLAAFDEFRREPGAEVERLEIADAQLARAIANEIGIPAAPVAPAPHGFRLIGSRRLPRATFAWAAAAAVVIAGAWIVIGPRMNQTPTWRGERDSSAPAFELRTARASDGQTIVLEWPAAAGATAYRVHLTREDLSELAALEAGAETRYDLWLDAPPLATADPRTLLVQVEALASDRTIARSRPVPLVAP
jgi:hypothetical protein